MKRLLLVLFAALSATLASAQVESDATLAALIHENHFRTGVNTNPYEYLPAAETPVPKGYKAFYISHYGRHGSRSDWSGTTYDRILEQYTKAHEAGVLSPDGEKAFEVVAGVISKHNKMNGRLTARGAREHRAIANRMYTKYRKVFTKGSRRVRAVSSTVPRCIVSMAAFTGELLSLDPKMQVGWDTGEEFMKYCSSNDPSDVKKEAYKLIEAHAASHVPDTASFLARIFKDPAEGLKVVGSGTEMLDGTMAIAAITGAFDYDGFLLGLFNEEDLLHYSKNVSMNLFLRQCNSKEFGDRRMAVPEVNALVEDVVNKADEAIRTGDYAADFRFGHDYQLLAFCARIGVKGIGERLDASECTSWPGYLYSPFAGNFQMIFYRNGDGDVIVKCYINERETTLLTLEGGPYYRWEDVKTAFNKFLK